MYTLKDYHDIGNELDYELMLRFEPIAMKVIWEGDQMPEDCVSPSRSGRKIPALCQAYAQVRRNREHLAIYREDHWCIWPVVSMKLGEMDEELTADLSTKFFVKGPEVSRAHWKKWFPIVRSGKKIEGLALAPLNECGFEPDIIIIYCSPAQARQLMMAAQFTDGEPVHADFDIVGACMQAVVPILNGKQDYTVAMPDDGEYERALVLEDEMLFSMSAAKLPEVMDAFHTYKAMGFCHRKLRMDMNIEYPRPDFYNNAMKKWGLKTSDDIWDLEH